MTTTIDIPTCERPGCTNPVKVVRGKPTHYCGDNCRMRVADAAYRERKAAEKAALKATKVAEPVAEPEPAKVTPLRGKPKPRATTTVVLGEPNIKVRPHHGRFLAEYRRSDGKIMYRYGDTAEIAVNRMAEALGRA